MLALVTIDLLDTLELSPPSFLPAWAVSSLGPLQNVIICSLVGDRGCVYVARLRLAGGGRQSRTGAVLCCVCVV